MSNKLRTAHNTFLAFACLLLVSWSAAQNSAPVLQMSIGAIAPDRNGTILEEAVDRAVAQGLEMVTDEFGFNAEMLNIDFAVTTEFVATAEEAVNAAERLLSEQEIHVLIGGWGGLEITRALSDWAAENRIPFINAGASADVLRGEACQLTTFHLESSDAMYLDAMAGWYVRSGFRRWFVLRMPGEWGEALHDRLDWALRERHFGARIVREREVSGIEDAAAVADRIRRDNADVVVLLVPAAEQIAWLEALEAEGITTAIAAWPDPESQSRTFMQASREAAPTLGSGQRILAFEATLDRYGAREINARYRQRFGEPMDPPAWAAYQSVKIAYEGMFFSRSSEAEAILSTWTAPNAVFDLWKGIGTSFRPWDHQMRQSMYLVKIREDEPDPFAMGILVGELPAIYLPGTDPIERLDQMGDLEDRSTCTF